MKQNLISYLATFIFTLLVLSILTGYNTHHTSPLQEHDPFIKLAIFPAILSGSIFALCIHHRGVQEKNPASVVGSCLLGIFLILLSIMSIFPGLQFLNARLDQSPVLQVRGLINDKYEDTGRYKARLLVVRFPPASGLAIKTFKVNGPTFLSLNIGNCVTLSTYTGAFGVRWVKKIEKSACN